MKKLIVILILPISISASDVYYCVDDAATGFSPKKNFAVSQFIPQRFKIMIDFERNMVQSDDLYFKTHNKPKCVNNLGTLNCIQALGQTFIISKANLKYFRSGMFNPGNAEDDIYVAYGKCEKF